MERTKTGLWKRGLSLLLALMLVLSLVPAVAMTAVAADEVAQESSQELADGQYIVPILTMNWNFDRVLYTTKSISYSPRCLLEVNGNKYTVTVKVNSDYISAWLLDNSLNSSYPKVADIWKALGADEGEEFDKLVDEGKGTYTKNRYSFSEENNSNFNKIEIKKDNDDDTWCYASFDLYDYSDKFYSIWWSKYQITGGKNDNVCAWKLDVDSAYSVVDLKDKLYSGKAGVAFDEAKYVYSSNGNSLTEDQELKSFIDTSADVIDNGNVYNASIKLNKDQLDGSNVISVGAFTSKTYIENSNFNNSLQFNSLYEKELLNKNDWNINVDFDDKALIYGIDIRVDTEKDKENREASTDDKYSGHFGTLYLTPDTDEIDVSIPDSNNTGVYVTGKSSVLPVNAKLTVLKDRAYTDYPETANYTRDGIIEWGSNLYNDPKHWFYIRLTDSNGSDLKTYDGITLHIPMEKLQESDDPAKYAIFAFHKNDGLFFNTDNFGNEKYGAVEEITDDDGNISYEFQYLCQLGDINIQGATFAYMQVGDYADIHKLVKSGDDDGIYKATAQLQKIGTRGSSMANAAMDPNVMIVIHDGEAKVYYRSDYLTVLNQKAYIGELMPYDVSTSGVWFEDGAVYTNFLTDDDGELVSNCGYDPITEAGCVKGGIITLSEKTYDSDKNCYNLAIVPPAMLGGVDYSTIQKDELTVHFRVTDLEKVADYSEENIEGYVLPEYHFESSALLRKIRLAETYLADEDNYTIESIANLKSALELAQTVYDNEYTSTVTASNAYEEQINLVQAAIDALVLDESAIGDKTELEALVAKAKAITADEYTNSSYAALTEAIEAAEKVLAKDAVKQSRLDEQVQALQAAIDALEKKPETALDKDNLADGTYTLYADMIKTDRASKSMSDNAIDHTVQLDVINGEYYVTMHFKGLSIFNQFGYLKNLSYYDAGYTYNAYGVPQGTVLPAEVLATQKDENGNDVIDQYNDADNLYPETLKFKLVDKASEEFVPLQVFVPIMEAISEGNGTQDVLMKLDWTTLKAVEPAVMIGDVNGDEKVNIDDATAIQRHLAEFVKEDGTPIIDENDKTQFLIADTDGDGRISINDVTMIQRYLAELVTKLG